MQPFVPLSVCVGGGFKKKNQEHFTKLQTTKLNKYSAFLSSVMTKFPSSFLSDQIKKKRKTKFET